MPNFMKGTTRQSSLREVDGDAFKKARLEQGLSYADLANQATLSAKQIEQIENGEAGSFYSLNIKNTAAMKLAKILGISDQDVFKDPLPLAQSTQSEVEIKPEIAIEDIGAPANEPFVTPISIKEKQRVVIPKKIKNVGGGLVYGLLALLAISYPAYLVFDSHESSMPGSLVEGDISSGGRDNEVADTPIAPSTDGIATPAATPEKINASPYAVPKGCDIDGAKLREHKASYPAKPGSYVYLLSKDDRTFVCIEDASGKVDKKELVKGVGINFSGTPPFKVASNALNQVEIYYQGSRVPVSEMDKAILLSEVRPN